MNKKKMMYGGSKKKMMMYGGKKKMMKDGGKLKMVMKDGKMVPFYAADGKGKMQKGGKKDYTSGLFAPLTDEQKKNQKEQYAREKRGYIFKFEEDAAKKRKEAAKGLPAKKKAGGLADSNLKDAKQKVKDIRKAQRVRKRGERGMERDDAKRGRIAKRASRKANRKMDAAERKLLAGKQAVAQGKLKKAARKTRKVGKKLGMKMGGMKKMYQSGGFLEKPTFDLDRDSL